MLEGPVPVSGQPVHGILDWEHRYAIMRYHSALHVLEETVYQLYNVAVTSVGTCPDRMRMDFSLDDLRKEQANTSTPGEQIKKEKRIL